MEQESYTIYREKQELPKMAFEQANLHIECDQRDHESSRLVNIHLNRFNEMVYRVQPKYKDDY